MGGSYVPRVLRNNKKIIYSVAFMLLIVCSMGWRFEGFTVAAENSESVVAQKEPAPSPAALGAHASFV